MININNVGICRECRLCILQPPLFDKEVHADIMVVGLSAKNNVLPNTIPLDNSMKSGRIVLLMENVAARFNSTIYRTNLVKCPPMGENGKLRYPSSFEIADCFPNLLQEIDIIQPKLIVLFGKIVQSAFKNYFTSINVSPQEYIENQFSYSGRQFYCSYHPSYIMRSLTRTNTFLANFEEILKSILKEQ